MTDVRGHGYRCACVACKAYRRDGQLYEARVVREYAWALARSRRRMPGWRVRIQRAWAWAQAQACVHGLYCDCEDARKSRAAAREAAYDSPVVYWDLADDDLL